MPSGKFYPAALLAMGNKEVDFDADTFKVMLLGSGYTPNYDTHNYLDDVVANEITGTGYTATGASLTSVTFAYVAANSWATARANSTAYLAGQYVRPSAGNGYIYRAQNAGTSAGSAPTWPTVIGDEVADGGVTWTCVGTGAVVFDAADVSWASATFTARYAAIYDSTPGTNATRPLIALVDLDSDRSPVAATFSLAWDVSGIVVLAVS